MCHQDSSELSSPPSLKMRINNFSQKHIFETKFSPFQPEMMRSWKSPNHSVRRGIDGKRKLNEIIEGIEGKIWHNLDLDSRHSVLRIMVCEDNSTMRDSIVKLLQKVAEVKKIAVDVKETINGLECLNAIYQGFISGNNFDAVLIDEVMPFMKGSKCINLLTEMYKDGELNKLRKISISSYEDPDTKKYLRQQGCDDFMTKPHTKETIGKFLESLVPNILINEK
jgi:CheY-like chemotaxis protein